MRVICRPASGRWASSDRGSTGWNDSHSIITTNTKRQNWLFFDVGSVQHLERVSLTFQGNVAFTEIEANMVERDTVHFRQGRRGRSSPCHEHGQQPSPYLEHGEQPNTKAHQPLVKRTQPTTSCPIEHASRSRGRGRGRGHHVISMVTDSLDCQF